MLELLEQLNNYTIDIIPRTNNRYTYAMASTTSLVPIDLEDEETILSLCKLSSPSYTTHICSIPSCLIADDYALQVWYFDIYDYLKDQSIPLEYTKHDRL